MSANKKKKGSSKKEKSSADESSSSKSNNQPSPKRLLFRIVPFWVALAAVGLGIYVRQRNNQSASNGASSKPIPTWSDPDPRVQNLLSLACQEIYCHPDLRLSNRTLRAAKTILVDEKLFEIPRSMQLWDLDAYRDPFVRKHLFKARHKISGNRLAPEAFLAAYLALEMQRAEQNPSNFDPLRLAYFQSLPTWAELQAYHPTLQDTSLMSEILGRSVAHSVLQGYHNMIYAEWDALSTASDEFQALIGKEGYLRARVNVLTRVLNVGTPGPEEVMPAFFIGQQLENQDLLQDELHSYFDLIGVSLTEAGGQGCIALIPLADLFNHHPNSNVQFQYKRKLQDESGRSFVAYAARRSIEAYTEPMVSYGTMSDAHLYGRYGFNNGDGSGPIQLSIAFHHELMKLNISDDQYNYMPKSGTTTKFRNFQKRGIIKYLMYDDGFAGCIPGPSTHPDEAELKRLKMEHLLRMANDYERWNMLMAPRAPNSLPAASTEIPITLTIPQFETDFSYLLPDVERLRETCRMMSLINSDYDGKAIQVLKENKDNSSFVIGSNINDALEFRSYMCVSRWFGTRLVTMELRWELQAEFQKVTALNGQAFSTFNWTASHVRLGEMQASQAGYVLLFNRVSESWEDKKYDPEPEYNLKVEPCPEEYASYLHKEDESSSDFVYF